MQTPWKQPARKCPALSTASPEQPPAESFYTALQRQDTEVYACMQNEDNSPPFSWNLSQEKPHMFENDSDGNLVYENL
ncbi:NFAT activating protein with ITAM motif 1 [Rhinolophus ferrumequinum]|nr:NFAT activating protein with ITAM motif 1 [Rhinolophus ferrumequinum]